MGFINCFNNFDKMYAFTKALVVRNPVLLNANNIYAYQHVPLLRQMRAFIIHLLRIEKEDEYVQAI